MRSRLVPLKRLIVGHPLRTSQAAEERVSKPLALGLFSSDALSSVAYATEEILFVLILAGSAGVAWSIPISLMVVLVLALLTISYRQIIFAYPSGGGAYTVVKANLGKWPGLVAAAAVLIDHVLTVAVSAATAALTSAFGVLAPYRESLALGVIALLVLLNLRGVRESSKILAIPTYLFLGAMLLMVSVGLLQMFLGPPVHGATERSPLQPMEAVTLFLLLRAFSAGCTAVTGVDVVAGSVRAFRHPADKNAGLTLILLAIMLGALFVGITMLAVYNDVLPLSNETVVSQIARATFGTGPLYYGVQAATLLVLALAANSSFIGFPRLLSLLARDGYMPHQMTTLGDRLVFSNGILLLGTVAGLLIMVFHGETHALMPLYAGGVFLSFTLAQAGMLRGWLREKGPHWINKFFLTGIGAVATGVAQFVIVSTKFVHGAWIVVGVLPLILLWFRSVRNHYLAVNEQTRLHRDQRPSSPRPQTIIIPISTVNRAAIQALDYARTGTGEVRAVFVNTGEEEAALIQMQWSQWGSGVPLTILPSPDRSVIGPLVEYIEEARQKDPHGWVTVIIPEIVPAKWWQHMLHNQRAFMLKLALLLKDRVIVSDVPLQLQR